MSDDGSNEDVTERVRVAVRVRPRNQREISLDAGNIYHPAIKVNDLTGHITVCKKKHENDREARCAFDRVFPTTATQEDIFEYVSDSVQQVAQGFNCTIFAYGQTGTGKTHTMLGKGDESTSLDPAIRDQWGLIPRAIESLFEELRDISRNHGAAAIVHCSYMQIYNNEVYDLLQTSRNSTNQGGRINKDPASTPALAVREMIKGNDKQVYVSGLSAFRVTNVAEAMALLHVGNRNRTIRATELNEHSSRSHALLQLSTEVESRGGDGPTTIIRRAKLNLVDLAGSEKWATDVTMGMERSRELTAINQSLSALGNVISALTDSKRTHIPYRDSKLTRLLQDSLGGNTRTVLIATISEDESALEETISTLQFAERTKNVTMRVRANEVVDDAVLLAQAQREIARLKVLLKRNVTQDQIVSLEETVARLTRENAVLVSENKRLRQNASMAMRKSNATEKESTPKTGFEANGDRDPLPPRFQPVSPRSERSINKGVRPASATLPKASSTKPAVSQLQLKATAAFEAAANGQNELLEEIQTERRELERELCRLEQQHQSGQTEPMDTKIAVDDDDLCPMCRRVIDDHSDAELDRCIEQESRLAQPVISALLQADPAPIRAKTTPRSENQVTQRPTRPRVAPVTPPTASTQNSSPYLQDLMIKTLNETSKRRTNVPVPSRKPSTTIAERPATAGEQLINPDPRTSDHDQSPPIVRQGSKSVKALKKFQASSPYSTSLSKLRSTADKRASTSSNTNQNDESVECGNDLRLTNSIRDIGIQLTIYKFRYDCWYPCTIVGYDGKRKLHCCQYTYGDKQWQDISSDRSKIRLIGRIGTEDAS